MKACQAINVQLSALAAGARTTLRTIGGAIPLPGAVSRTGASRLMSVTVHDYDNVKGALTILFFSAPMKTPPTDNGAYTMDVADLAVCLGKVEIVTGDYTSIGAVTVLAAATKVLTQPLVLASSGTGQEAGTVYAIAMVTGTPTYASGKIGFVFDIETD
jgi:hypothetical protein